MISRADVHEEADEQLLTETLESRLPATASTRRGAADGVPLYYQGASEQGAYPEHLASDAAGFGRLSGARERPGT